MGALTVITWVLGAILFLGPRAPAPHDVDVTSVARLFLDEVGERTYTLSVVDTKVPPLSGPQRILPEGCSRIVDARAATRSVPGLTFSCARALRSGDELVLPWSLSGVVVLARWSDGTSTSAFFRGRAGAVRVDVGDLLGGAASRWSVANRYLRLGTEHILGGVDHLLFVLGLLLLVRGVGPLVKTITAFTVAHSLTLGASVLGLVPVQRAAIEAAIALSIVLLAREIVMADRGVVHLTHRRPWAVAMIFGLLHGFGFAGALGEIGLPDGAIPFALLFFNVGVEAGQLLFVAALLIAYRATRPWGSSTATARLRPLLGYGLGALSTLWLFDRLPAIWGG